MKKIINRIVLNKIFANWLIKPVLRCHSWCYKWAGRYGVILNNGVHPKHRILRYKEWFLENIEPGWIVMDIGSNTGMLSLMLAEKAAFVYGIELSEKHVAVAKTQHAKPNIEYICADATTHNYDSCQPVNCVTLSNVLEHIEHRVDFLKMIVRQVKWIDASHRRLLFRVPMINRGWIVLYKKELGLDYRLDPTHHIEYTLEQFEEELGQAGIVPKKVEVRFGEIYAMCEAIS
jgi:SAM-dependent methyltransferase